MQEALPSNGLPESGEIDLTAFWGKAGVRDKAHPAILHMIDVGQVAAAFLDKAASPALIEFLADPFAGNRDFVYRFVPFIAACHDIGKISPGFQDKRADLAIPLRAAGLRFGMTDVTDHCRVTRETLLDLLRHCDSLDINVALRLSDLLGAHHGRFLRSEGTGTAGCGRGQWKKARQAALAELGSVFGCSWSDFPRDTRVLPPAWSMVLTGLIVISDWVGSSDELFPYAGDTDISIREYARTSRRRAERAIEELGWTRRRTTGGQLSFSELFAGFSPNDMQLAASQAAADTNGPALVLIEAPMGIGKTEAALWIAEEHLRRHRMSGLYYALPTQATSNQMFNRLRDFLERRYAGLRVDLHLLHGLSDLNEQYKDLRLAAISQDPEATVQASSWFAARKRGLLAPFGVGTVDQALLAVLNVPHMFVRLFGLWQKVVILDEVHAYDTYMSGLLDRLIEWLSALRATVIVLSATLPAQRRAEIVSAYKGNTSLSDSSSYPQVISVPLNGNLTVARPKTERTSTIALESIAESDGLAADLAAVFAQRLHDGGCGVWICNTVARAQSMYVALQDALRPLGIDTYLLHARFPVHRRIDLEGDLLAKFGKGTTARPERAVLVATQVVEQSLDLDFDLMVTDLAPVDLVLQRAGRLHRHVRPSRPPGLSLPTLIWVAPVGEDGIPDFGIQAFVYEEYVLLRSWLALCSRRALVVPDDVPALIEEVYGDEMPMVDAPLQTKLAEARRALDAKRESSQRLAEKVDLPRPVADQLCKPDVMWLEEERPDVHETLQARTRLTRPSVTIACAHLQGSGLRLDTGDPLDLERSPARSLVRAIRLSCVTVQKWEWVRHFLAQDPPESWRNTGLLANCRLAQFDNKTLSASSLQTELSLSPELGIVIRKTDSSEGGTR